MASISREPNGRKTIQFVGPDRKRRSVRLGKATERVALAVKVRIEHLVAAALTGHPLDDETARWVAALDTVMYGRLEAVGLVPRRKASSSVTLGAFLDKYTQRRIDVKPATQEVWSQTIRNLKDFYGEHRDLRTIDEPAAEDFKTFLLQEKLAPTTVSKRLQFARQFFRAAMKRKLVSSNPFAAVASKATTKSDRQQFIPRDHVARLLEACPNIDWRVIVVLARYGGLRCPSEVLSLKWTDIDWARDRMYVTSPKTEHHPGKDTRETPLFPEVRAVLAEALELAPDGAVYVVNNERYRQAACTPSGWRNCNLRTHFERIVKRAGLTPWPRLFHALRGSRETELVQKYPLHVVTAWLGNTPRIAMKHYLMVTDDDFRRAVTPETAGGNDPGQAVQNPVQLVTETVHFPVQQPSAGSGNAWQETTQALVSKGLVQDSSGDCHNLPESLAERTGFEPAEGGPPHGFSKPAL